MLRVRRVGLWAFLTVRDRDGRTPAPDLDPDKQAEQEPTLAGIGIGGGKKLAYFWLSRLWVV